MRGLAALSIAIFHLPVFFSTDNTAFFSWAWINVDLFFLLSGIVMTHVYEARVKRGTISFTHFLSHRIARLWPLHLFAMLTMLLVDLAYTWLDHHHIMDWSGLFYTMLLNVFLLQHIGLHGTFSWDENAWSLTPEIVANIVWFYLLATGRLSSKLLALVVLGFAVIQYNHGETLTETILGSYLVRCIISYAMGCLLYRHFIQNAALGRPSRKWSNLAGVGLTCFLGLIIYDVGHKQSPVFNHWEWILVLFVFPALTYFILQPDTYLNRFMSSRFLVFLGTISYSVYLLHIQIGRALPLAITRFSESMPPAPVLGFVYLAATIGIATLSYKFIEEPSRRFLRNRLEPFLKKIFFEPSQALQNSPQSPHPLP